MNDVSWSSVRVTFLAGSAEHLLDGLDAGQPAGDQLVAHQPLVLGLALGIVGMDDGEQPGRRRLVGRGA